MVGRRHLGPTFQQQVAKRGWPETGTYQPEAWGQAGHLVEEVSLVEHQTDYSVEKGGAPHIQQVFPARVQVFLGSFLVEEQAQETPHPMAPVV